MEKRPPSDFHLSPKPDHPCPPVFISIKNHRGCVPFTPHTTHSLQHQMQSLLCLKHFLNLTTYHTSTVSTLIHAMIISPEGNYTRWSPSYYNLLPPCGPASKNNQGSLKYVSSLFRFFYWLFITFRECRYSYHGLAGMLGLL